MGAPGRGHADPGEIARPAQCEQHGQDGGGGASEEGRPPESYLPPGFRPRAQDRDAEHSRVVKDRRVLGRVGQRQENPRCGYPPDRMLTAPDAGGTPGRHGQEQQRRSVVGRERTQVQRRRERGEQRGGEEGDARVRKQPGRRAPDEGRRAEHEDQGQQPGRGQPAEAVGDGSDRRVDDGSAGKPGLVHRNRGAVQPMRPLKMPGRQVQSLVPERGPGPHHAGRERGLDGQYSEQRPSRPHRPR